MTIALCIVIGVLLLEVIGLRVKLRKLETELKQRRNMHEWNLNFYRPMTPGYAIVEHDGRAQFVVIGKGGEC